MNFNYCNEVIELANRLNFRETAEALFLSQPTLSKHISGVEKEIGFRIFERTTTHVEITDSGRIFIEGLRETLQTYNICLGEAQDHHNENVPLIRISGPLLNGGLGSFLSASLAGIGADEAKFSMIDTGVKDCESILAEHSADLAIGFRYKNSSEDFLYTPIKEVSFGIACHKAHPLALKKKVFFSDLVGEELVSYPKIERERYYQFLQATCLEHGLELAFSCMDDGAIYFPYNEKEVIVGVYFENYFNFVNTDAVIRKIDDATACFSICVVRRRDESNPKIIKAFDLISSYSLF